jgi:hypothetical protein
MDHHRQVVPGLLARLPPPTTKVHPGNILDFDHHRKVGNQVGPTLRSVRSTGCDGLPSGTSQRSSNLNLSPVAFTP